MITEIENIVISSNLKQITQFQGIINDEFANPTGTVDCSAIYGILINKIGIAVNEFGACDPLCKTTGFSKNVILQDIWINNIILNPIETIGFLNIKKEFLKDFSGSMIMATRLPWFKNNIDNRYAPDKSFVATDGTYDVLLLYQVLLYKFSIDNNIKWAKGSANISENIINWVVDSTSPLDKYGKVVTGRNSDIMAHVMKGCVGLRLDFVNNSTFQNVNIKNIQNIGTVGLYNNELQGYLDGTLDKLNTKTKNMHLGHPKSDDNEIGYTGNICRAVSIINCNDVQLVNTTISNILVILVAVME